jgi:hypothetical protein
MSPDIPTLKHDLSTAYLLPGFDEYLLGYTDRSASLDPAYAKQVHPGGNGVFAPTLISQGRVVGTWKRAFKKGTIVVAPNPFNVLSKAEAQAFAAAAERYGAFMKMPSVLLPSE